MAISRIPSPQDTENGSKTFLINNGDLNSLEAATQRLGFVDEASLLRFLIAVGVQSATRSITITDKDGKVIALSPTPSLLNPAEKIVPTPIPVPPAPTAPISGTP